MSESLVKVLARLESKVKELSDEVEVLKNKKDYNLPLRVTELEKKALSTKGKKDHDLYVRVEELEKKSTNKQTIQSKPIDVNDAIKSVVDLKFINNLYRN